nr:hypothetical protein [Eubacterium sp.]
MRKKIIAWVVALAFLVSSGTYLVVKPSAKVVKATSVQDFDDSLSTAYELGTDTTIEYAMNAENEQYDVNVLYKFEGESDSKYTIHLEEIAEDNDTYVNVMVMDGELNEYALFSTCDWDAENETVVYKTEMDYEVELLGEETYYVLLTCASHEYKDTYSGTYRFSMAQEESLEISELAQDTTSLDVSTDQTTYRKISVEKSGWYELSALFNELMENSECVVQIDLYDANGNLIIINEGKCYLEAGVEYDALMYLIGDDTSRTETVNVSFQSVESDIITKGEECTFTNDISYEFTAEETEQLMIYSCSEAADPQITVVKGEEEIAGNEDYSWGESTNEKDFGVVVSVEKGQKYVLLMKDNAESGEEIIVRMSTYSDAESTPMPTPSPTPMVTPRPVASQTPTASEKPMVVRPVASAKPVVTVKPTTAPSRTATPETPTPSINAPTPSPTDTSTEKSKALKLSKVKCKKNTKKISGKVSVKKATVKIKVDKKSYKKAKVKGKKFTLKLSSKLKKKTKIRIKVTKKGYKSLVKSYKVK